MAALKVGALTRATLQCTGEYAIEDRRLLRCSTVSGVLDGGRPGALSICSRCSPVSFGGRQRGTEASPLGAGAVLVRHHLRILDVMRDDASTVRQLCRS